MKKKQVDVYEYNTNVAHKNERIDILVIDTLVGSGDELIATVLHTNWLVFWGREKYPFSHEDAFVEFAHAYRSSFRNI